ncbi:MAG TPA: copper resistance protein CopC [Bacilli bacterium]
MRRYILFAISLAIIIMLIPQGIVFAHTELVASTPADGSTNTTPVREISLTFSENIQSFSTVAIQNGAGQEVKPDQLVVDGKSMKATFASPLPDGSYTVAWKAVADDGHIAQGTFSFTVGAAQAQNATANAGEQGKSGIRKYGAYAAAAVIIILIALLFLLFKPKREARKKD